MKHNKTKQEKTDNRKKMEYDFQGVKKMIKLFLNKVIKTMDNDETKIDYFFSYFYLYNRETFFKKLHRRISNQTCIFFSYITTLIIIT